jgi:hypothetical protein
VRAGTEGNREEETRVSRAKKKRVFSAGKAARRVARELIGQPPPERVIPDKRRKPPKHRKPFVTRELE